MNELTPDDLKTLITLCEIKAMDYENSAREHARDGMSITSVRSLLVNADNMRALKCKVTAAFQSREAS